MRIALKVPGGNTVFRDAIELTCESTTYEKENR
jgi:hypothetical protein